MKSHELTLDLLHRFLRLVEDPSRFLCLVLVALRQPLVDGQKTLLRESPLEGRNSPSGVELDAAVCVSGAAGEVEVHLLPRGNRPQQCNQHDHRLEQKGTVHHTGKGKYFPRET